MKKHSDYDYKVVPGPINIGEPVGGWPELQKEGEVMYVGSKGRNIFEQAYGSMTDEAREEAKKIQGSWGLFTNPTEDHLRKLQLSELQEVIEDTSQKYPGQELPSRKGFALVNYGLEPFVHKLKNFPLVDEVYILEDNRDPENPNAATSVVRLLVRLINMSKTPPAVLEHQNMLLTEYLMNTSVENAVQVEVTFQYTEVYFGAF